MTSPLFTGALTAIITPFSASGRIDFVTFEMLIERQIAAGIAGIVVLGTTGETPTVSPQEHKLITKWAIELIAGRCRVVIGTSSNATDEAIEYSRYAAECGADAVLQSPPYYNRPTQRGLLQHFQAVDKAISCPIIYYEVPSRTGTSIELDTLRELIATTNAAGIKIANTLDYARAVLAIAPPDFAVLSGDDDMTLELVKIGGAGVVSVLSNILPAEIQQLVDVARTGNTAAATELHERYLPLMQAMFIETNPQPVKTALAALELCGEHFRLPMVGMAAENKAELLRVLAEYDL